MYTLDTTPMPSEFVECWSAAGRHLDSKVDGGISDWMRAHHLPPFLEHLSFRLGNQLFFIRIEDIDGVLDVPGNREGLRNVAQGCDGHACLLPMRRELDGEWTQAYPGWGLLDLETGKPVDPVLLITDERVPVTDWELQDFAVRLVREQLERVGFEISCCHGDPAARPSIWFNRTSEESEWLVVKATRNPEALTQQPPEWRDLALQAEEQGTSGHFAWVQVVIAEPTPGSDEAPLPLWRGHGVKVLIKCDLL